jgi:hypothetical protein
MRARHLLVVPATLGLVLTGLSPAAADYEPDYDDLKAKVVDIKHRVHASDDGDSAVVRFKYKCEGDADDITTTVTLRQRGDELSKEEFDAYLDCDGYRHWGYAVVYDNYDTVENGYARATVKFEGDYRTLDREREYVRVHGVEDYDD